VCDAVAHCTHTDNMVNVLYRQQQQLKMRRKKTMRLQKNRQKTHLHTYRKG